MRTITPAVSCEAYAKPTIRTIEVNLNCCMMLLNSNGRATQTTPDLEEQDYSNIWGN